jgi:uncharacterized RDD family membrane protein YckC
MNESSVDRPAALWLRIVAGAYDLLPLLALWFVTAAAALAATAGTLDYHAVWYRLALLAITIAYFVLSWIRGGQTIGMRAWRLRVVGADGRPLDATRALVRFAVACVSLLAAGIGFLWCGIDPQRRAWHDIAARTLVVRVPKRT